MPVELTANTKMPSNLASLETTARHRSSIIWVGWSVKLVFLFLIALASLEAMVNEFKSSIYPNLAVKSTFSVQFNWTNRL